MSRSVIIVLFVAACLFGSVAVAGMLEMKSKQPSSQQPKPGLADQVSDRNLLGLDYSGKYRMPLHALSPMSPKVIRVLAIRVNFRKEVPDDPLTTGNGNFDMRTKAEFYAQQGYLIDPAPHNRSYFEKHLKALSTYYDVVSNGRLKIEYDVYPRNVDSAYQLDSSMAHYGAVEPVVGLTRLVYDAMHTADIDPELSLYDSIAGQDRYDAYIIFHAGSDQQNNFAFAGPDTPLRSVYRLCQAGWRSVFAGRRESHGQRRRHHAGNCLTG